MQMSFFSTMITPLPHAMQSRELETYNEYHDEENNKGLAHNSFCIKITKADGGHCDHQEIQTLPIGQKMGVLKISPWVSRVLQL